MLFSYSNLQDIRRKTVTRYGPGRAKVQELLIGYQRQRQWTRVGMRKELVLVRGEEFVKRPERRDVGGIGARPRVMARYIQTGTYTSQVPGTCPRQHTACCLVPRTQRTHRYSFTNVTGRYLLCGCRMSRYSVAFILRPRLKHLK